ncbi:MAG: ThuA domain-containing protein [Cyclobacteriaceae bacterium]|nr:ThuA domain-containing protein [Cyclobacteriaceae bacterium]
MKKFLLLLGCCVLFYSCTQEPPRVLVFSKTKGFRHESIKAGKEALIKLGAEKGFGVDTTESADVFTEENLKKYRAVIFLSTTGDVLDQAQQNQFMRFIQAGGGYVGIHAAADTEYDWWWYGKLVGAYFKSHPQIQEAKFKKVKPFGEDHLPDEWIRTDELYNYNKISDEIIVLYNLDESSYEGGENGDNHPIAWYHDFDGGRSFYTGMGHTNESFSDSLFLNHLYEGLKYAIGNRKPDFSKARARRVPEENRFTKNVLGHYFDEPTEMTILPDSRIIFIERKGAVKLYDPETDSINVINTFNVWTKYEDGMLGITKDPGFVKNGWLYIYYSHPERSSNILSRFVFDGKKVDQASEIEMLEVPVQRETCCHTGGSLEFGPDGNLFLSTGDNTSPFESDGFSPADERPGRSPFDALKSSSNTNDLRGKILRIRPQPDGTYTIPDGNLFPKGEEKTRPEIYVMGNRNPYRISIDRKTGFLYWGEVGPDAGNDSPERGPRGYDEVNQAQKAGYFGWPLFVGGNYAYAKYDFESKTIGAKHDPNKPINTSPNNTGKTELPPVSAPFIWYPYDASPDFPLMKTGGRNAMAGPVYYSEDFKGKPEAYPDYFDGKLIIYDWMRNWIHLVTMNEKGAIMDIEPFIPNMQFNNIIDMAFGPDGKLYTLEYGTQWFKQNMDARLSRIDYNGGNRPPQVVVSASKISGALPLEGTVSAEGTTDPDGDAISYEMELNGQVLKSATPEFKFTFEKAGIYRPKITAIDAKGAKASGEITIIAGNEPPAIEISVNGNTERYIPGGSVDYAVIVTDKEDGSTADGKIPAERVKITMDYHAQGFDMTAIAQGHQRAELPGKLAIAESDCKSCHLVDQKSAGPSYRDVAKRYAKDVRAVEILSDKILNGGSGNWGEVAMAAHPQLTKEQANQMVEYILSLANEEKVKSLPLSGKAPFAVVPPPGPAATSAYVLTVTYDDAGANGMPSLSTTRQYVFKAPVLTAADAGLTGGARKLNAGGFQIVENIKHNATAAFTNVDLTGVSSMSFVIAEMGNMKGGTIDVWLDSTDGTRLGTVSFAHAPKIEVQAGVYMRPSGIGFKPVNGKHNIVLVFRNDQAGEDNLFFFSQVTLGK